MLLLKKVLKFNSDFGLDKEQNRKKKESERERMSIESASMFHYNTKTNKLL